MNKMVKTLSALLALVMLGAVLTGCFANFAESGYDKSGKTNEQTAGETEAAYTTGPGIDLNDFEDNDFENNKEAEPVPSEETKNPDQEETKPTGPAGGTTQPNNPNGGGSVPTTPNESATTPEATAEAYVQYNKMSGAEQKTLMESFATVEEFFAWYNAAKSAYIAAHPDVEIGDGSVDLGDVSQ